MNRSVDATAVQQAIENAPLLSANAHLLLQITSNPDHDLDEVIRIIRYDAALTARVLQVVNSAAFGLIKPMESLDRAVSYLGERMVLSIVLSDNIDKLFQKPLTGYEGEAGALWRHNLFTAIAAREIARKARHDFGIDLAFTAGLLHDIGKALISDFLSGTAEEIVTEISHNRASDYLKAEQQRIGFDHAEIGSLLAKHWKLPESLCAAIAHHHEPSRAEPQWRPVVYAVHLGDILAMMGGCGTGSDEMQYHLDQNYTEYFDFNSQDLSAILLEADEAFRRAEASLRGGEEMTS